MIAMLRGNVLNYKEDFAVLEVNGVGYKVYVPQVLSKGQEITLHTFLHVREDALTLYGFLQPEQLEMFELLISVTGMGPKGALGALAHFETVKLKEAVATGDINTLTKIPGIGKKIAQRLVLELKDKFQIEPSEGQEFTPDSGGDEVLEALVALGYAPSEARQALARGLKDFSGERSTENLLKLALKNIK